MTRSSRQRERERESQTEQDEDEGVRECSECGSENLIKSSDRGELICDDCGLVVEEGNIDPGPEWR
ncbi:transcription initiation factor IIB 3, partial [Halobacteriales archaeon QH_2_65_14]